MSDQKSFFEARMEAIGFDPKTDFAKFYQNPDEAFGTASESPLFWEDKHGNICIGITGIDGKFHTYDTKVSNSKSDANKQVNYQPVYRIRYKNPSNPKNKYGPCKKGLGSFLYVPKSVSEKYRLQTTIKQLVITEGEFKTFVGAKHGLDIVGLPGFNIWKSKDMKTMFYELEEIVNKCKVQQVILLSDADTMQITWEENKDVAKRFFNTFFASVKNFKKYFFDHNVDLIYSYIEPTSKDKGLDDLLINNPKKANGIVRELKRNSGDFKHFRKFNITTFSERKIKEIFKLQLSDKGTPQAFYQEYEEILQDRKFIFNNGQFQADENGVLKRLRSKEAAQYLMVGTQLFKKGVTPVTRDYEVPEQVLQKLDKATMKIQLGNVDSVFQRVLREIEWYDGFVNIPSHMNYKYFTNSEDQNGNILKWYNSYKAVSWNSKKGDYTHTLNFFKHIFGEEDLEYKGNIIKSYELGLDYMKLVWEKPTQKKPILCLVSKDRETGKSTFWDYVKVLLQQNCKKVEASQLSGQFTSYYAHCSMIYMEETYIDRVKTIEAVKELSTAKKIRRESKGKDAGEIDSHICIGLASNHVDNFANVDSQEVRFWVREVPKIKGYINNFFQKLVDEIPAFLHFIENRKFVTENENRSWFNYDLIQTEALKRVKEKSRWSQERELEDSIRVQMEKTNRSFLQYTIKDIKELFFKDDHKITSSYIRDILEKMNIDAPTYCARYKRFSVKRSLEYSLADKSNPYDTSHDDGDFSHLIKYSTENGRYYTFYAADLFEIHEILMFASIDSIIELEKKFNLKIKQRLTEEVLKKTLVRECPKGTFADYLQDLFDGLTEKQKDNVWLELECAITALDTFEDIFSSLQKFVSKMKMRVV